jgi:hypothetical protein
MIDITSLSPVLPKILLAASNTLSLIAASISASLKLL